MAEKNIWDEISLETLGERLRQIRAEAGEDMTLRQFCRHIHQDPISWQAWESGKKSILYVETLIELAISFDVSPSWLLFGAGPKSLSKLTAIK